MPIREYGSLTPGPGQSPLIPDNAHQPSIAYVPYLLTGDRYYAEEMAFWANYSMLRTYPQDGVRGANGILAYNEVRGYGWALRNMADAAAYYPDASPVRAYLAQKVTANLQWLDNYANAQGPSNPFKIMWLNKRPDGAQYISMWEQNYLAHAIDRANKQGFAGGLAHRDAIARFQLKMFTSDPDYPRAQAAPYVVAVGTPGNPFVFFTTMAQIWAGTQGQERPFAGYYGPETRMTLMMGVEGGWTGAQGAYDYLWPFIGNGNPSDLAQRAGWAVDFYPGTSTPPPPSTTTAAGARDRQRNGRERDGDLRDDHVDDERPGQQPRRLRNDDGVRIGRHRSGAGHEPQRLAGRPHRGNDVSLSRHGADRRG